MSQPNPRSLACILAAPWQQRRNAGRLWGNALVVALCLTAPVVLLGWSRFAAPGPQADVLRLKAGLSAWIGVAALLVAAWATFVGNVLQQNHPTLARLLPHHVGQLRQALLVGWGLASLTAAALPGNAFDAPLAWACATAGGLALLAAALRWPLLWLGGIAAPFVVGALMRRRDAAELLVAFSRQWSSHQVLVTCVIVAAGASVLVLMVRSGGNRHRAGWESRDRLRQALFPQRQGGGAAPACSSYGWIGGLAMSRRPYAWWMDRLLARRDSPVMARLLVGLGPALHWTTRAFESFRYLVVSSALCAVVALVVGGSLLADVLPWLAFSVLTGVCTPALQAVARLHQSRREQALLVLLPGVPRGARLNRWLAWQMSAVFVLAALGGSVLAWTLDAFADSLQPGVAERVTAGMTFGIAAALLPQVAWQWRRWAHLGSATGAAQSLPVLAPMLLGIAVMALHWATGIGYVTVGVALAVASLAYCAWRWSVMGAEPTALPVGRLA